MLQMHRAASVCFQYSLIIMLTIYFDTHLEEASIFVEFITKFGTFQRLISLDKSRISSEYLLSVKELSD